MVASYEERHLTWHQGRVTQIDRERLLGQKGLVIWLTGLSGSGKSTLARELEERLAVRGVHCYVLDGDNIRHGLCCDLGFSAADRSENIRRVAEVAALFVRAGLIAITACISPYRAGRDLARRLAGRERFVEVYLDTPLAICEERDPKGLYAKARRGEIAAFTGIDDPYEAPDCADLVLDTSRSSIEVCTATLLDYLRENRKCHI